MKIFPEALALWVATYPKVAGIILKVIRSKIGRNTRPESSYVMGSVGLECLGLAIPPKAGRGRLGASISTLKFSAFLGSERCLAPDLVLVC